MSMIKQMNTQKYPGNSLPDAPYILVAGMGKSGIAAARFLKSRGKKVIITDIDASKTETARALEDEGIIVQAGIHDPKTFENAEMIVASPGIPLDQACFERAASKAVPIRGEMDLACDYIEEPIVAITGTNGKTTVTTLISQMLSTSGKKVFTGGNIGNPLINYPDEKDKADVVVVEVSSFQLDTASCFKPDIAVLLNISQDHLDRYSSYAAYRDSKWRIFMHQTENDIAIIQNRIQNSEEKIKKLKASLLNIHSGKNIKDKCFLGTSAGNTFFISENLLIIHHGDHSSCLDLSQSPLPGRHNRENLIAAAMASFSAGATVQGIETVIKNFKGLDHRIQYVDTIDGVSFYNDSKATNTDAVETAISCFNKDIVLIMGGKEKNTDFTPLKTMIQNRVKQIIAMGETRHKIKKIFDSLCPALCVNDMEEAVNRAFQSASSGEIVLLSPACASFDMFSSYGDRGNQFMENVKRLHLSG